MKLALGSAQFGMAYGINNSRGQVPLDEVRDILRLFCERGGNVLDTAYAYGNSELVLGDALDAEKIDFKVISKFPKQDVQRVDEFFHETLARLKRKSIYGYILHDFNTFVDAPEVWDRLRELKNKNLVQKIGFSLYHPDQAELLLNQGVDFDLVQIPYNIFDQRFDSVLARLKSARVEVHARSAFLQGLFFREPPSLSPFFDDLKDKLTAVGMFSETTGIPLYALLLGFAVLNPNIDYVVIGVDSIKNLRLNLAVETYLDELSPYLEQLKQFKEQREEFILPYLWK